MRKSRKTFLGLSSTLLALGLVGGGLSSSAFDTPFVDAAAGDVYTLVTDVGELQSGDSIVIANQNFTCVMGSHNTGGDGYRNSVNVSFTENNTQFIATSQTAELTITITENSHYLLHVDNLDAGYLYWDSGNSLNTSDSEYEWDIAISDNVAVITSTATPARILSYNNGSPRFACYGNANQQDLAIFKKADVAKATGISISGTAEKLNYYEGEAFDATGLTVTASMSDSTTLDVTQDVVWTPNPLTTETTEVTATYTNLDGSSVTATYSGITVTKREATSIAVTTLPSVTEYAIGESIDYTGIVVTATFADESTIVVTDFCTFDPEEGTVLEAAGTQMVTVTYGSVSTTFNVEVSSTIEGTYTLVSPEYGSIPEGVIVATGGGATASWAIPNYITATWEQNSGSNPINLSYSQMRFYQRHRITFTPTSPSVILKQIVFTAANSSYASRLNSEVTWSSGVNHSVSGDVVTATTATSMPIVLTMPSSGAQIQVNTIEITYTVSTESFGTLDHIELNTNGVKTEYHALDAFTTEGLIVTAYDTTGVTKVVDNYTTSIEEGHIFDSYGPQTVVVTYSENDVTVEASYEINVSASPAYSYTLRETDYEAGAIPPAGLTSSLGGLNWSIYSDASISAFDNNRGLHIGISNSQASYLDFRSELFLGTEAGSLVTRVEVVLAGNSGTEGIVSLSVGGTEFTSTDTTLEGSSLQTFVFTGTPSLGHINLHIDKAETGDGVFYINSINVYADINAEAGAAVRAARTIESVDVCDTSAENITNLQNAADAYNSLGENSYIDSIMIDDYQNPGDAKRSFNLLNVGEKIAAINNVLAGENVGNAGIVNGNNSSNDTILIVACALLGVAALGGAFFYMKKRKEVR